MSAQGVLAVMDGALVALRLLGVTKLEAATEASMIEARATVADLIEQLRCNQGMVEHITSCAAWFRANAATASQAELMTWADNLMSCVTPRGPLNSAVLARAGGAK